MNVAFIIPTGLGCTIGGHAGDATPAAKLIAQTCDKLLLHPNVVNASDINEMPENSLYIEGSILDRFLEGTIQLQEVRSNRVLVAVYNPRPETINAVNAAIYTIGMDAKILKLKTPIFMEGYVENGIATGQYSGVNELINQVKDLKFDALALASPIIVSNQEALTYFREDNKINPWGGIEAIVSRKIANAINKPTAHAPIDEPLNKENKELFSIFLNEVVDPRKAAEVISSCYIHCILKGLYRSPRIGPGISRDTIGALVTPSGCIGRPHLACLEAGIPVIAIIDNRAGIKFHGNFVYVANYLEAAGYLNCLNAGINPKLV